MSLPALRLLIVPRTTQVAGNCTAGVLREPLVLFGAGAGSEELNLPPPPPKAKLSASADFGPEDADPSGNRPARRSEPNETTVTEEMASLTLCFLSTSAVNSMAKPGAGTRTPPCWYIASSWPTTS